MTFDTAVLKKSATKGDYADDPHGGVMLFMYSQYGGYQAPILPPFLPYGWSRGKDAALRQTVNAESMWASAINIAITKIASLGHNVKGDAPQLVKRAQDLLVTPDLGKGWVTFVSKNTRDFLTTDNGAFIEIVRANSASGSRILGLMHLDSMRCTRTGDPEIPVLYRDMKGIEHELRAHQVISLVDMPDPSDGARGTGMCATSRAYRAIVKLAAIEQYLLEKVSGSRALAMHLVKGLSITKMESALATAQEQQAQKGQSAYMGAIVVPLMGEGDVSIATIPLAELPDGFNRKEEFDISLLTYADAIGLDPQELQPLTGQSLGSGAQSQVLDDKASGRGMASYRQQLTHLLNEYVFPAAVTFSFSEKDYRDQQQQAEVAKAWTDVVKVLAGDVPVINASQALQTLVDKDILPKEYIPEDTTPTVSLSDAEKPQLEGAPQAQIAPALPLLAQKADDDLEVILAGVAEQISALTAQLESGAITADAFEQQMTDLLERVYTEAYTGGGGDIQVGRNQLDEMLASQKAYLSGFAATIKAEGWQPGYTARAQMYGESAKAAYWAAATQAWPLPALPGDGTTQCLSRCKCSWEVSELEGIGNADATWHRSPVDNCQSCVQRAQDWAPLRIRDGVLQ